MGSAHPQAMQPSQPGPTRTSPPQSPAGYPFSHGRYRSYTLYAATSVIFLLEGLLLLEGAWMLGQGPEAWAGYLAYMTSPFGVAWNVLVLGVTIWFGARTYFKLFVKTQPPHFPLPPRALIPPAIGIVWVVVTVALVALHRGLP